MIFRVMIRNKSTVNRLDKAFDNLTKDTRDNRHITKVDDGYYKLRDRVKDVTKHYFDAKQKLGIHLPTDKKVGAELDMDDTTSG